MTTFEKYVVEHLDHIHTLLHKILHVSQGHHVSEEEIKELNEAGNKLLAKNETLRKALADTTGVPNSAKISKEEVKMSSPLLQPAIDAITRTTSLEDGILTFIQTTVPQMISSAVAQATVNGATEAELQPFNDLTASLNTKADAIVAAMLANTPVTPVQFKAKKS